MAEPAERNEDDGSLPEVVASDPASATRSRVITLARRWWPIPAALVAVGVVVAVVVAFATHGSPSAMPVSAAARSQGTPASSPAAKASSPALAFERNATPVQAKELVTGAKAVIDPTTSLLYGVDSVAPISVAPRVEAGHKADGYHFAVEMSPERPVMAAVGATVTTLQSGLTAATSKLVIQVFDRTGAVKLNEDLPQDLIAKATSPLVHAPAPTAIHVEIADVKVGNGIVVVTLQAEDGGADPKVGVIAGLDVNTGAVLWTADIPRGMTNCMGIKQDSSGFRGEAGITTGGLYVYATADSVIALSLHSGAEAWVNPLGQSCNYYLDHSSGPFTTFIVLDANGGRSSVIEAATGKTIASEITSHAIDPVSGALILSFVWTGYGSVEVPAGKPALEVLDPATLSPTFSLSSAQGTELRGLTVTSAFDGRIWITTPAKSEVIDARDGKTDPRSSDFLPVRFLGGTAYWTVTGVNSSATLTRHPAGHIRLDSLVAGGQ
jgi:hypothetical protein